VILGGIAAETSFTRAEIDAMTVDDARWWWNSLAAYHERVRQESS
jgi:hypothetical protein